MTTYERQTILQWGQYIASGTLALLILSVAAHVLAQYNTDVAQAVTNATLTAELTAVSDRVGKLETQNSAILLAVVGSLITQIVQLRGARK